MFNKMKVSRSKVEVEVSGHFITFIKEGGILQLLTLINVNKVLYLLLYFKTLIQ